MSVTPDVARNIRARDFAVRDRDRIMNRRQLASPPANPSVDCGSLCI